MTTTPLDVHRQANATSPDLAAALSTIADRGVEFVYFQAITITGRVLGKVVPARHFERLAIKGVQQHQTAIANLQGTREGVLLAGESTHLSTPQYPISRPSLSCRGTPTSRGCSAGYTRPTTWPNSAAPNSLVTRGATPAHARWFHRSDGPRAADGV